MPPQCEKEVVVEDTVEDAEHRAMAPDSVPQVESKFSPTSMQSGDVADEALALCEPSRLEGLSATKQWSEPKRPLSAFFLFCENRQAKAVSSSPSSGEAVIAEWAILPKLTRQKFEEEAKHRKQVYDSQVRQWKSQGFHFAVK